MTVDEAQSIMDMYSMCEEFDPIDWLFADFKSDDIPDYVSLYFAAFKAVESGKLKEDSMRTDDRNLRNRCRKCCGRGIIETYRHIDGGVCYRCNGTGREI